MFGFERFLLRSWSRNKEMRTADFENSNRRPSDSSRKGDRQTCRRTDSAACEFPLNFRTDRFKATGVRPSNLEISCWQSSGSAAAAAPSNMTWVARIAKGVKPGNYRHRARNVSALIVERAYIEVPLHGIRRLVARFGAFHGIVWPHAQGHAGKP